MADVEQKIRDAIAIDEPWGFVEKATTLVRLSGSGDEREAIDYLTGKLESFGVKYDLPYATLFVSWPGKTTLRIVGDDSFEIMAKTSAMGVSTNGSGARS